MNAPIIRIALLLNLVGCTSDKVAYVPGPDFQQAIMLVPVSGEISVGEPVRLVVTRSSDGWIKTLESKVDKSQEDACFWVNNKPPVFEEDAGPSMRFIVNPKGSATFNIGHEALSYRTVTFSKPGEYQIHAHSALWCAPGINSNTITITVR